MDSPLTIVTKVIFVSYHTYMIIDTNNPVYTRALPTETGIIAAEENSAAVTCGTHTGKIRVTIETWSTPPPPGLQDWQDVAEISLPWTSPQMELWGEGAEGVMIFPAATAVGTHRLRISARNRMRRETSTDESSIEEHLLQLWPGHPGAPELLKGESMYGASRRS